MRLCLEKLQQESRVRKAGANALRLTAALLSLILFALVRNTAQAAQEARYTNALLAGAYEEAIALQPSEGENYLFLLSAYERAGRCGEGIRLVLHFLDQYKAEVPEETKIQVNTRVGTLYLLGSAYDDSFSPSPKDAEAYLPGPWRCLAHACWEFSNYVDWAEVRTAYSEALKELESAGTGPAEPGETADIGFMAPAERERKEAFLARFAKTYGKELGLDDDGRLC